MTANSATIYLACAALTALVMLLNPPAQYTPRATPAAFLAMALLWPLVWGFVGLVIYDLRRKS